MAEHDPDSARQQGMNVDRPAVSRTTASAGSQSGMGVDVPRMVGEAHNPQGARRTSGLHVDGKNAFSDHPQDGHDVHVRDHTADNQSQPKGANKPKDFEGDGKEKDHFSHYCRPSASGLNVDSRNTKSSAVGATPQDHGVQETKSAIHVDKAGSVNRTRSGMNVDESSSSIVHLAEASHGIEDHTQVICSDIKGNRRDSDHESLVGKVKNVFRGNGDSATLKDTEVSSRGQVTEAQMVSDQPASVPLRSDNRTSSLAYGSSGAIETAHVSSRTDLPTIGSQPSFAGSASNTSTYESYSSSSSTAAGRSISTIPMGYDGPVPQVAPGEDIVWVRRIIQTDYYGDCNDEIAGKHSNGRTRRSSVGSFLDRIRGEGQHQGVDKGKQKL